jgi:hypothetical protein
MRLSKMNRWPASVRHWRGPGLAAAAVTMLAVAATAGTAVAGDAAAGGTITACYKPGTQPAALRVRTGTQVCPAGNKTLTWNKTGPRGVAGPPGQAGPTGRTGPAGPAGPGEEVFTSAGTYTVPAGVTSVLVELRGGGGGGDSLGGGQASELRALIPVSPGSQLTVTIGAGGNGTFAGFAAGNGFASTVAVAGVVAAYAGGGGGGGVDGAAGEPGTAVVSAPATGLEDLPAAAGSPAGAGGGPPGYAGSGGAGAAGGPGQTGGSGYVLITPLT